MYVQAALRDFLANEFQMRREKNSSYSMRAFARHLDVPVSSLSEVLRGKRNVTRRMSKKLLAAKLPMHDGLRNQTTNFVRSKSLSNVGAQEFNILPNDLFEMISSWHFFAIISACELDGFNGSPKWVAHKLGITQKRAKECLSRLCAMGLLGRDAHGNLRPTHRNLATQSETASEAIRSGHREHLQMAEQALMSVSLDERDFSFLNIAMDPRLLGEAKKRIRKFRRQLCAMLESAPGPKTKLFRLGVQLYPLPIEGEKS